MEKFHPKLKSYFGYCLYKSAMRLRSDMDEALKRHGIMAPHVGILSLLLDSERLNQHELGQCMGIDKASMVKFVDLLEKKRLVHRTGDPSDRRAKMIEITPEGRRRLHKAREIMRRIEDKFLQPLSTSERRMLEKTLPKLLRS